MTKEIRSTKTQIKEIYFVVADDIRKYKKY